MTKKKLTTTKVFGNLIIKKVMKELSIEQKAKAYDEAIERAINHRNRDGLTLEQYETIDIIFPELKENKDENIRKAIYSALKYLERELSWDALGRVDILDAYSWLEKQGEQQAKYHNICDECVRQPTCQSDCFLQQEQKPADKVEPKFKVGDWIIKDNYSAQQVKELREEAYILDGSINGVETLPKKYIENNYHLWTIQDAKDGDVLKEDSCIFILKKLKDNDTAIVGCVLHNDGEFETGLSLYFDNTSTHPATKEQRDTLFAKMREAGYEWNADEKKLKKIDKENLTEFEIAVKNVMEEAIECGDTHNLKADAENLLRIVQPAWNKEDLVHIENCISLIGKTGDGEVKWLKSLKERVGCEVNCTTTKEWSEEDEKHLNRAVNSLDSSKPYTDNPHKYDETISWLKSLRDRYTWKPSLSQLNALGVVAKGNAPDDIEEINSLYNDLKKLREE